MRNLDIDISPLVPILAEHLDNAEGIDAVYILMILMEQGPEYNDHITSKITNMIDNREEEWERCADLLKQHPGLAKEIMASVRKLVQSDYGPDFSTGARLYMAYGGENDWLIREAIDNLTDIENNYLLSSSIFTLRRFGPEASGAVPALEKVIQNADEQNVKNAREMIRVIKGGGM